MSFRRKTRVDFRSLSSPATKAATEQIAQVDAPLFTPLLNH